jgi:hypothetical protein
MIAFRFWAAAVGAARDRIAQLNTMSRMSVLLLVVLYVHFDGWHPEKRVHRRSTSARQEYHTTTTITYQPVQGCAGWRQQLSMLCAVTVIYYSMYPFQTCPNTSLC